MEGLEIHFFAIVLSCTHFRFISEGVFPKGSCTKTDPAAPSWALVWVHLHKLVPILSSNTLPATIRAASNPVLRSVSGIFKHAASESGTQGRKDMCCIGAQYENPQSLVQISSQNTIRISNCACGCSDLSATRSANSSSLLINVSDLTNQLFYIYLFRWNCFCASIAGQILWRRQSEASICFHAGCHFLFASAV